MSAGERPAPLTGATPSVTRRLACFVYEGLLLGGVLLITGALHSGLTQQRQALQGRSGLQAVLFVVLALYFTWFWSRSGQTVAMKTWHIRLVMHDGTPVSPSRAAVRYLASWLWFLPALTIARQAGLAGIGPIVGTLGAGVLAYAALAWLRADRQFWHDALCATRLVDWRPASPAKAESGA